MNRRVFIVGGLAALVVGPHVPGAATTIAAHQREGYWEDSVGSFGCTVVARCGGGADHQPHFTTRVLGATETVTVGSPVAGGGGGCTSRATKTMLPRGFTPIGRGEVTVITFGGGGSGGRSR